jgi:hypothetical protein
MHFAFSVLRTIIQSIHPALNRNLLLALIGRLVYNRGAEDKEIGRWRYRGTCVSTVEVYDPATDTWTQASDMPGARGGPIPPV